MPKAFYFGFITVLILNVLFSFVLNQAHLLKKYRSKENFLNRSKPLFVINYSLYVALIFVLTMLIIFDDNDDFLSFSAMIGLLFAFIVIVLSISAVISAYYLKCYLYSFDKSSAEYNENKQFLTAYLSGFLKILFFVFVPFSIIMMATKNTQNLTALIFDKDGYLSSIYIAVAGAFFGASFKHNAPKNSEERYLRAKYNLLCVAIIFFLPLSYLSVIMLIEQSIERLDIMTSIFSAIFALLIISIMIVEHSLALNAYKYDLENPPTNNTESVNEESSGITKGYLKRKPRTNKDEESA